jgi:hypothetical protein
MSRNLKDRNATWIRNQPVSGSYLGISYRGELDESGPYGCRMGPRGTFIFVIKLSEPINVYGQTRHNLSIWASDDNTVLAD